jgi:hypothetical protein
VKVEERKESFMPGISSPATIVFAIEQPADVDVGEIIVRPTAQS